jgi:cobalt/nickel transport system permease protein
MSRIASALDHLGRLDELAFRDTPAARLDPRAKLLATLGFVAVVASVGRTDLGRLAPFALYPAALAALGDVPARPLLVRLALASPFALGVAAFEPLLHREPVASWGGLAVSAGWLAFATILAKFALSLGAALLLVATTGFDDACVALRRLGAPRALVVQVLFTWRYLFVLGEEAARTVRAHALRAPAGNRPTLGEGGQLLGHLVLRALDRAERIHAAMLCRGFDGRYPVHRRARPGAADLAFVAFWAAYLSLARAVDLTALVGSAVTGGAR